MHFSRRWIAFIIGILLILLITEGYLRYHYANSHERGQDFITSYLPTRNEDFPSYVHPSSNNGSHIFYGTNPINIFSSTSQGKVRVIGIGDSHMTGVSEQKWGMLPEDCYASYGIDYGVETECINLGVGGYDISNKEKLLTSYALNWDPDIIILQLLEDDCTFDKTIWQLAPEYPQGAIQHFLAFIEDVNIILYKASYIWRKVWVRFMLKVRDPDSKIPKPYQIDDFQSCTLSLTRFVHTVRESNITLITVLSHNVMFDELWRGSKGKWFLEMNSSLNLSALIIYDVFKDVPLNHLRADDNGHYNQQGYELVHQALSETLFTPILYHSFSEEEI